MTFFYDCRFIVLLHAALLVTTFAFGGANLADVRVQLSVLLFLLPGWWIAPLWMGEHGSVLRRYVGALTTSVALHAVIAFLWTLPFVADFTGASISNFTLLWMAIAVLSAMFRFRTLFLHSEPHEGYRLAPGSVSVIAALMLFSVCVYRLPRSNDIHQFILQQQDMLLNDVATVSSIGMQAMEIEEAMPRWRAHLWHLFPCWLSSTSGVAVDQVLQRYGTIPIAFSVLLSLLTLIRQLVGRSMRPGLILIATLGPVILWYRNYSAFNYSFRITNNLLLDKDFALFFLIPCVTWLAVGWMRGRDRYLYPLLALFPAIIRFHPLTSVYLVLLIPPVLAWKMPLLRSGVRRAILLTVASMFTFVVVFLLGDAQGNHEQIREIIQLDLQQSETGRPTHYWAGFYNSVPGTTLESNTTEWSGGKLRLKSQVITSCGLLLMMHLALLVLVVLRFHRKTRSLDRGIVAGVLTLTMLWGMWLISGPFLTAAPHFTAGYERLHWFAFSIAIGITALAFGQLCGKGPFRARLGLMISIFVMVSSVLYLKERLTPWGQIRGINSLLDYELPASINRRNAWASIPPMRSLIDQKPKYLQPDDRALLLSLETTRHYWLIRQGVFWCDPYVEAFAWTKRGDDFMRDRQVFYSLLDRVPLDEDGFAQEASKWIRTKGITVLIDPSDDAKSYIGELAKVLPMQLIEPGVWRITKPDKTAATE